MRKFVVLLGIVAIAAAPSVTLAKTSGAKAKKHVAHHVKKKPAEVASADPNANTGKLFGNMFK